MKSPKYQLNIGVDYLSQPAHKPKVIPRDFLAHFINVKTDNLNSVIEFANSYNFGGYLFPEEHNSVVAKFGKIHEKYNAIIKKLLEKNAINYTDIQMINEDLDLVRPKISLREKVNNLLQVEESFAVYVLNNTLSEDVEYEVIPIGSFEVDSKASKIQIKVSRPVNSEAYWYFNRVQNGVTQIQELYPSEKWQVNKDFMKNIILTDGKMDLNDKGQPVSMIMNFRIGKTDFTTEEMSAVWSPATGESFIAKRIWDYINSDYQGVKFKQCKICGDTYTGKSPNYCSKIECKREWDSRRHS